MSSSKAALTFSLMDCDCVRGASEEAAVGGAFRTGVEEGLGRDAKGEEGEDEDKDAPARVEEGEVDVEAGLAVDVED